MPTRPLILKPGQNRQQSQQLLEGGWFDLSLVRFRDGLPQKWSGWQHIFSTLLQGLCRAILAWQQLNGTRDVAFGTNRRLYVAQGITPSDVTPLDTSGTLGANPFTTAAAGAGFVIVTVAHTAHGRSVGDFVQFDQVAAFDGTNIAPGATFVEYTVVGVVDVNDYTISVATSGSAGAAGGGSFPVGFRYLLPVGPADAVFGAGWGVGPWGAADHGWGTASPGSSVKVWSPRVWSLDNWGEDLIANVINGALYVWTAATGVSVRAIPIAASDVPKSARAIFVALPERHLVALGAEVGGGVDPMLIRWSNVESYNVNGDWTATATNSAGSFRLSGGTQLIGTLHAQNVQLILSDDVATVMQFIGLPFVYSFRTQGSGSGLIGPNAGTSIAGVPYWWGPAGFFRYVGYVDKLESSLHGDLFGSGPTALNRTQQEKVFCGIDSLNNEVIWYYPSVGGSGECDRYIAFNIPEQLWYGGANPRTAWTDRGTFTNPIATHPNGTAYFHEIGLDDDGSGMVWFMETGFIPLDEGDDMLRVGDLVPDWVRVSGPVTVTVKMKKFPNDAAFLTRSGTLLPTTRYIRLPLRGRYGVVLRFSGSALGQDFRFGKVRIGIQRDGGN